MANCVPESEFVADLRDPSQDVLVRYLSRRYSIAAEATERMVGAAFHAAREVGLDPLLVLAVISVESRFNPIAESVMGAKGLMQIIPKYHQSRLVVYGGEAAVFDPESNIRVGAEILRDYVHRTGTLEAGLQFYNGAMRDSSAHYAQRVMAERARLMVALGGS
jgi:soluble lytic murein transglycosylase-like protein